MKTTAIWIIAIVAIAILGAFFYWQQTVPPSPAPESQSNTETNASSTLVARATFYCDKSRTINAAFYKGPAPQPQPGQPPVPNGRVEVSLDGGPIIALAQTISADGARYSDGDPQIPQGQPGAESFVFWNKGNSALIMRNNAMDLAYTNCNIPE